MTKLNLKKSVLTSSELRHQNMSQKFSILPLFLQSKFMVMPVQLLFTMAELAIARNKTGSMLQLM